MTLKAFNSMDEYRKTLPPARAALQREGPKMTFSEWNKMLQLKGFQGKDPDRLVEEMLSDWGEERDAAEHSFALIIEGADAARNAIS